MKLNSILCVTALSLVLSLRAGAAETYFSDPAAPPEVQAAHESFLRGDFKELGIDIKRALLAYPGDATIQADMLGLFDQAYALKGDSAITPDWKAPEGITWLNVSVKRRHNVESGEVIYRMSIYADLKAGAEAEQVQIIKYPGEVIVDKQGGIGSFEAGVEEGHPNFWFGQNYQHSMPHTDGLYLITLKMKGQDAVQGWFVVSKLTASKSPAVATPVVNQSFGTGTPTFQWTDFVSPEHRSFENRKVFVSVSEHRVDAKDNSWTLNVPAPITTATVGAGLAGETGAKSLAKGDYIYQLNYRERLHFGDISLSRECATAVPFSIR